MHGLLLPRQLVLDDFGVTFLSESVTKAGFHDRGNSQLAMSREHEEKYNARSTICTFLEHSVFQKLRDNLFPRLEYKFILVCVPVPLTMHLESFLNVVVDPPNVQDDIILGSFSIFILRLVKLQFIDFLCWD